MSWVLDLSIWLSIFVCIYLVYVQLIVSGYLFFCIYFIQCLVYHMLSKMIYTNVSDVPRSLQSWVSTIQTVVLTADVFQLFIKPIPKMPNLSDHVRLVCHLIPYETTYVERRVPSSPLEFAFLVSKSTAADSTHVYIVRLGQSSHPRNMSRGNSPSDELET